MKIKLKTCQIRGGLARTIDELRRTDPRKAERIEAIASIFINIVVFFLRLVAGLLIGSGALITDAFHGLSDSITSLGVFVSSKIASRPPDEDHPLGHGKAADLGSLFIGVVLFVLGGIFLVEGVRSFLAPAPYEGKYIVFASTITLISVAIKYYNYIFAKRLGDSSNSSLCLADALHHKMDALITLGATVGVIIGYATGIARIDALLTLAISMFILYEGLGLLTKVSQVLMDKNVEEVVPKIKQITSSIEGVKGVKEVIVRDSGGDLLVDLVLEVNGKMSLEEAHSIADEIESEVKKRIPMVKQIHIHEEPTQ
jgi:cation diffusion facilitator family transporter|uniref:Cation transporter n=1 Tax=Fervidicoccus fontis TaxID=683846 RepID=A0A7J3SLY5_9CREN